MKPSITFKVFTILAGIVTSIGSLFALFLAIVTLVATDLVVESMKEGMTASDYNEFTTNFQPEEFVRLLGIVCLIIAVLGIISAVIIFIGVVIIDRKPKTAGITFLVIGILQSIFLLTAIYLIFIPIVFLIIPGVMYISYSNNMGLGNTIPVNRESGYKPIDLNNNLDNEIL